MNKTIQLYTDTNKTKKGYPITTPDRVVYENGKSVKDQIKSSVKFDVIGESIDVPEINGGNAELVEKVDTIEEQMDKKINYLSPELFGAKGDGTTDDTIALKKLFIVSNSDTKIILGKNKIYKSTQKIDFGVVDSIEIDGNGSLIEFHVDDKCSNFNIGSTSPYKSITLAEPITIDVGESKISLNSTDISDVKTGDIALLVSNTINGYSNTEIIEIVGVRNSTMSITSFIDEPILIKEIRFFKVSNNITIKNLNIKSNSANAITLQLTHCKNIKIENCEVIGNKSRVGFLVKEGLYGEFLNNSAKGYYDYNNVDNRTGYGFDINGNNIYLLNCNTKNCKHHVTVSTKTHKCHNVIYDNFKIHANDSDCPICWALADFHGNAIDCKFINGTVNVSKDFIINNNKVFDTAFGIRGKRCGVENCTIIVPKNIKNYYCVNFYEYANSGNYFRNNTVIGNPCSILVSTSSAFFNSEVGYPSTNNIDITNNKGISEILIGDLTKSLLKNIDVISNHCKGSIKCVGCSQNVLIDRNKIDTSHIQDYHINIIPHYKNLDDNVGNNIVVSNNIVTHGNSNGRMVSNNSVAPIMIIGNTFYSKGSAQLYKEENYGALVLTINNTKYNGETFITV